MLVTTPQETNSIGPTIKRRRVLRAGVIIVLAIAFVNFFIGIYHGTHRGHTSGVIEPISALLLMWSTYLVSRAVNGKLVSGSVRGAARQFRVGVQIVIAITFVDFILGVYHLTHHGHPSAVIELTSTAILTTAIYLLLRAWRNALSTRLQ